MMMRFASIYFLGGMLFLASCQTENYELYSGKGKRPIYLPLAELGEIKNLPPQPIAQTGTIYLLDTLFFMLEYKKGIHVYSLSDSAQTVPLTFLQIPAITDFTVANNRIYADSWRDLVTIDISNLLAIREVNRNKDAFVPILYPTLYSGYFECVDESKGVLIDWEDAQITNAACETF